MRRSNKAAVRTEPAEVAEAAEAEVEAQEEAEEEVANYQHFGRPHL